MKQTPVLIKTFCNDAAQTSQNLCVVASGTNAGNVMAPGAAGATKFVGVTQEPTGNDSSNPQAVMVAGIAQVRSDGSAVIAAGDYLTIADTTGRVKTQAPGFGGATVTELVGMALSSAAATADLLVDMLIQPMLIKP